MSHSPLVIAASTQALSNVSNAGALSRIGAVCVLLWVSLSACGGAGSDSSGGSSSSAAASSASSASSNAAAPTVSNTSPAADAVDVATTSAITATFGEDMLSTSIDASSISVADVSGALSGSVSFDGVSNVVTFTPDAELALLRDYTATLSADIANLSGTTLGADYSWNFTTRDGEWQGAAAIGVEGDTAQESKLVVNKSGAAMLVWVQTAPYEVYARHYDPDSGWGAATLVSDSSIPAYHADVAISDDGSAMVAWYQTASSGLDIWANHYDPDTGWQGPEAVEAEAGYGAPPIIAMNASGMAMVVWAKYASSKHDIWSNRYVPGTGWGTAQLIENRTQSNSAPTIVMDDAGNAWAAWLQYDDAYVFDVWANYYDADTGWGSETMIGNHDEGEASLVQLAMAADGTAMAVWQHYDSSILGSQIWCNQYANSAWGSAAELDTTDELVQQPSLAANRNGDTMVVWMQNDGSTENLMARHYTTAAGWETPELIENNSETLLSPHVGIDDGGHAIAVWRQYNGSFYDIAVNRYINGAGWGDADTLESDDVEYDTPDISVNVQGQAAVLWSYDTGTGIEFWNNWFY